MYGFASERANRRLREFAHLKAIGPKNAIRALQRAIAGLAYEILEDRRLLTGQALASTRTSF